MNYQEIIDTKEAYL
ncbi:hypothetical protein NMV26_11550 [Pasteurella multocida]|nr:hypothetical protein [Pasteurella multocida]MDY0579235.1 hypothetical protein [Pasteurella multocida]